MTTEVKRPSLTPRGSTKAKKSSSLRLSFGPSEAPSEAAGEDGSEVFTPKKSKLSRQAAEASSLRKTIAHSMSVGKLPLRGGTGEDRPSYSKDYLNELKTSTPSTPKDLGSQSAGEGGSDDLLGVIAKFGIYDGTPVSSAIPSDAEIREKKERRARLAHERDYIDLNDEAEYESEIVLRPREKWEETRLVRDDEDIAEGFDEFVEDGRITLGKKAEKEQTRRKRAEMREMIEEAEGTSNDESDESEAERRAAYEATQTRAGTYRSTREAEEAPKRPRTPPKITPLPTLSACLDRLQTTLANMQASSAQKARELEAIAREKAEIAIREVEIQKLLKEAGEKYEQLRVEAELGQPPNGANGLAGQDPSHQHGLESFGSMQSGPIHGQSDTSHVGL